MNNRLRRSANRAAIRALQIIGLVAAALVMLARGGEFAPSPLVLHAGESAPVSCLNGSLRIEPNNSKLVVITCGNPLVAPRPPPVAQGVK